MSSIACILVLAGCAVDGAPQAAPSNEPAASPVHSKTLGPSVSNLPVGSSGRPVAASDLENLLPDEINGEAVEKGAMAGDMFLISALSTPDLERLLIRLGLRPRDVSVAFAYTPPGPGRNGVFAFEVAGATEQDLRLVLAEGRQPEIGTAGAGTPRVVGGKPTVTGAGETKDGIGVYRYAAGSIVFFISAGHESTAGEILSALP